MTTLPAATAADPAARNVDLLKQRYARWAETKGSSVDEWMTFLDDNIKFGSLAGGAAHVAYMNNYSNKAALRSYFDGLAKNWAMIHYTADEFVAQGDVVVVRGSCAWQNRRTQKVCSTPKIDFWRFRDGKAVEYFEYYDTAGVHAAAAD